VEREAFPQEMVPNRKAGAQPKGSVTDVAHTIEPRETLPELDSSGIIGVSLENALQRGSIQGKAQPCPTARSTSKQGGLPQNGLSPSSRLSALLSVMQTPCDVTASRA
jgi:hypothetical protein